MIRAEESHVELIELMLRHYPFAKVNGNIINENYGCVGNLNHNLLESAIYSGINEYYYNDNDDLIYIVSLIAFKMAKNHCFTDANKRTSLTFMMFLFALFGIDVGINEDERALIFEKMVENSDFNLLYNTLKTTCKLSTAQIINVKSDSSLGG